MCDEDICAGPWQEQDSPVALLPGGGEGTCGDAGTIPDLGGERGRVPAAAGREKAHSGKSPERMGI